MKLDIHIISKHLALIFLVALSGCSSLPDSKKVDTELGSFTYFLAGKGKPTVIFESGLADDMTTWQPVISPVQDFAQVFAYNRAGFRGSSSINSMRNGDVIITELRALLAKLALPPPYILVGHSLGGGYMELYAKTFPLDVAGVVLVDPNSSRYPERCKDAKLEYCDPPSDVPAWAGLFLPEAVTGEIRGFATTHAQINASDGFPDVPLVVLSASKSGARGTEKQKKANELYTQMHKELTELSSTSKLVVCDTCSHYLHQDKPESVVNAIRWVIDQGANE